MGHPQLHLPSPWLRDPGTPGVPAPNTVSGCCLPRGLRPAPLQPDLCLQGIIWDSLWVPGERVWVSVCPPQFLSPLPMAPSHTLPSPLQLRAVPGTTWGQFGTPARGEQGCSCQPSLIASQQLGGGVFCGVLEAGKQLGGEKQAGLQASGICHSILGSHCRGQSSAWLGQELPLSEGVQLIWGLHMAPRSGPAEPWQHPPLCTVAKGTGSSRLTKDSRCPPMPESPALSPGAF